MNEKMNAPKSYYVLYRPLDRATEREIAFEEDIRRVLEEREWNQSYITLKESRFPYMGLYRKFLYGRI